MCRKLRETEGEVQCKGKELSPRLLLNTVSCNQASGLGVSDSATIKTWQLITCSQEYQWLSSLQGK